MFLPSRYNWLQTRQRTILIVLGDGTMATNQTTMTCQKFGHALHWSYQNFGGASWGLNQTAPSAHFARLPGMVLPPFHNIKTFCKLNQLVKRSCIMGRREYSIKLAICSFSSGTDTAIFAQTFAGVHVIYSI